jgi:LmbE family N-acetylglucosaminyl deacetylase
LISVNGSRAELPQSGKMQKGAQRVAFYFAAHEDDWQLFMNPSAFYDVLDADTKTVFVHVTAGDAGLGRNTGGRKHPYYAARENGVENAIRFMTDSDNRAPVATEVSSPTFNGHKIRRVSYRNTVAYFLRLPDGGTEGDGYAETGHQSLKRLAHGDISTFTAVDGSASYASWTDLTTTLRAIIDAERAQASATYLHVPELDAGRNPEDHPDHYATAQAALAAMEGLSAHRMHYLGYSSAKSPENLSAKDRDMKCAVYAVTAAGVMALDHPMSWQHYDECFAGRCYFRRA